MESVINLFECGKNGFVEVFKNLARYRSENNFVRLSKHTETTFARRSSFDCV